ncbi:hypothetical protein [Streptomyces collinus]|uniref:hypothetical protein n=1 Tax=Streptomyces collinus TaxID=42684 RepID=UPI0036E34673
MPDILARTRVVVLGLESTTADVAMRRAVSPAGRMAYGLGKKKIIAEPPLHSGA